MSEGRNTDLKLKEWAIKRMQKMDEDDGDSRHKLLRSSAFHNYFDGYAEIMEPADNRRGFKVSRVYMASFFQADMSDRRWTAQKLLYSVLFLLAAAGLAVAAWRDTPCNYVWYCTLPQALSFGSLALLLISLINYIAAPRKLKLRDYKQGVRRLQLFSLLAAVCPAVTAAGAAVAFFLYRDLVQSGDVILVFGGCCVSAASCAAIHYLEKRVQYDVISNPTDLTGKSAFQISEL